MKIKKLKNFIHQKLICWFREKENFYKTSKEKILLLSTSFQKKSSRGIFLIFFLLKLFLKKILDWKLGLSIIKNWINGFMYKKIKF